MYDILYICENYGKEVAGIYPTLFDTFEEAHENALKAMGENVNIEEAIITCFETGEIMEEL